MTPVQESYPASARTIPTRLRERASYERDTIHAALDAALIAHVGYVIDGRPVVIPTIHARIGDRLYLHGSAGARMLRAAGGTGIHICVTATTVDALVLARSAFHHSMNYRSVVAHGLARLVVDQDERRRALDAIIEHVQQGRTVQCRPPSTKELAATAVLALDLEEVSLKARTGDPVDDEEDLVGPFWAGVVPLHIARGESVAAADLRPGIAAPDLRSRPLRPRS